MEILQPSNLGTLDPGYYELAWQRPTRLHELLGGHASWDGVNWSDVVTYLSSKYTTASLMALAEFVGATAPLESNDRGDLRSALFKRTCLEPFRYYPPTVLLGFYDLARFYEIIP